VSLSILGRTRDTLLVGAPSGPGVAPPGQYLLFIYAKGPDGSLLPSLPALLTLSAPAPPPSSNPPPSAHPSASGRSSRPGSGGGPRTGGRTTKGSGTSGRPATSPGSGAQPHAALASPASVQRSVGTGAWLGGLLLVVFVATFLGLRRMLRA
jgi:hypothetical protein